MCEVSNKFYLQYFFPKTQEMMKQIIFYTILIEMKKDYLTMFKIKRNYYIFKNVSD